MKKIELDDDVYDALRKLTTDFHQTPNDVLAALLQVGAPSAESDEPLVGFLLGSEFRAKFTDADKYLAILSWIASKHAQEFKEYIHSLSGGTADRENDNKGCRQFLEDPGGLQYKPSNGGHCDAEQGANHPRGEIGPQDVSRGRAIAAAQARQVRECENAPGRSIVVAQPACLCTCASHRNILMGRLTESRLHPV